MSSYCITKEIKPPWYNGVRSRGKKITVSVGRLNGISEGQQCGKEGDGTLGQKLELGKRKRRLGSFPNESL